LDHDEDVGLEPRRRRFSARHRISRRRHIFLVAGLSIPPNF
jgi:hypothetical protein